MLIKVKKFNENAVIPVKAYDKDFCYDLVAVSEEEIAPNVWKYGFGIGLQIDRGFQPLLQGKETRTQWGVTLKDLLLNLSIDIRPRSSVWKTGMVLSNCEGTVDEGYTGEISAIFYHVLPNMERYRIGQKIAQLKIGITFPCEFVEVDELLQTERSDNGYGSSGR